MPIRYPAMLYACFCLVACGRGDREAKDVGVSPPKASANSPDPPPMPTNPPIEPVGPLRFDTVGVTDSWKPSYVEKVALIDRDGPTLLVTDVKIAGGSWQVSSPYSVLRYPASGSIMIKLSENQWTAVKAAKKLAVQPMPKSASNAAAHKPANPATTAGTP